MLQCELHTSDSKSLDSSRFGLLLSAQSPCDRCCSQSDLHPRIVNWPLSFGLEYGMFRMRCYFSSLDWERRSSSNIFVIIIHENRYLRNVDCKLNSNETVSIRCLDPWIWSIFVATIRRAVEIWSNKMTTNWDLFITEWWRRSVCIWTYLWNDTFSEWVYFSSQFETTQNDGICRGKWIKLVLQKNVSLFCLRFANSKFGLTVLTEADRQTTFQKVHWNVKRSVRLNELEMICGIVWDNCNLEIRDKIPKYWGISVILAKLFRSIYRFRAFFHSFLFVCGNVCIGHHQQQQRRDTHVSVTLFGEKTFMRTFSIHMGIVIIWNAIVICVCEWPNVSLSYSVEWKP